jgi:hypothetical protein
MALHVDLIHNEFLAGYQECVARLRLVKEKGIDVQAVEPKWREIALRPLPGLDPEEDPEAFFQKLHKHLKGSHLVATAPHHEKDCPFHASDRIPAKRTRVRRRERTPA